MPVGILFHQQAKQLAVVAIGLLNEKMLGAAFSILHSAGTAYEIRVRLKDQVHFTWMSRALP